jgi:ribosome-binding factor A
LTRRTLVPLSPFDTEPMPSHRVERVAEAIREVVSTAILFEVADPRIKRVTVLGVEVSGDLRHASVAVTIMGTETEQTLALRGLRHATGFLQAKVAARLQTRFTPVLTFKRDEGVKKSIEMSRLIDEALGRHGPEPAVAEPETEADDDHDEGEGEAESASDANA